MKRRYVVGLVVAIGLIGVLASVLLWRRDEPIVAQATPAPTQPRPAYTPQPEDVVAPVVVERSPARGEELAADGAVRLVFDRSMDRGSVEAAFVVSPAVAGRLEWADDRTVRFLPAAPLSRATSYAVLIDQRARASDGAALNSAYQFRFATAGYLEVAQALPVDGSTEIEADPTITVVFNRPVVALKVVEEQDTLPQPLRFTPPIEGSGEWLNTSVYVFKPSKPLAGGTSYTASIDDLKDVDGNPLAQDFSWSWTTVLPKVLFADPVADAKLVSVEPTLTLQFNQPIDQASAEQSIELRASDGTAPPVKIEVLSETLSIVPTARLSFNTRYELVVAAGLQGTAGGDGMADAYRIAFQTVPLPRIVRTEPNAGNRNVVPSSDFVIYFNTPIDPDTVMANLVMTPAFTPTEVYTYFDSYSNEFHLYYNPKPSTDYKVSIGPNIADPYGNLTGQTLDIAFRTDRLTPMAQLIVPGIVGSYNANNQARVAVRSVNKEQVTFELYRISAQDLKSLSTYNWYDTIPAGAESIRKWTELLQAPLDTAVVTRVDLVAGGGKLEPGAYMLTLDDGDPHLERHVLVVSGLNLTLKAAERGALVWINDLASGAPAADLKVAFYDRNGAELGSAATDDQGVASIAIDRTSSNGVVALIAEPFGAIADDWSGGVSAWDFGLESSWDLPEMTAYIYTDRPIYRPDQPVEFKGVLRNEDDVRFSLPDNISSVEATITDAAGEQVFKDTLKLSDLGTFAGSLKLSAAAALGGYSIQIGVGDQFFNASFHVAAYRAPEFEVTVKPEAAEVVRGSAGKATAAATYFFGGPVAGVPVTWNVLAEDYIFKPEWAARYQFSATDDPWRCWECWWRPMPAPVAILSGSGSTDASGELAIEIPAELKDSAGLPITRSVRLTIEASATGKDNQVIAGRESLIVHAGDLYVGLAPQNYVGEANKEQKIDLVVADSAERRVANQPVEVEILRYTWDNRYIKDESGGGRWEWSEERTSVARQSVQADANGDAVVAWTPSEAGSYQVVARTRDRGNREVSSAIFVWVAGEGYVSWRRDNNDRINLIADRTSYKPGETADILIPSPFQGPHWALISVERGGILSHEVRRMEGNSAVYSLPLTAAHAPNVFVSVVLFTAADGATGSPGYKVGLLPLAVAPDQQSLRISLTPSVAQAEPGQSVDYAVEVTDLNGAPVAAELSLDLVDKAVLSLAPRTPDAIREALYGRRGLGVTTANDLVISADRLQEELERDEERQRAPGGGDASKDTGLYGAPVPTLEGDISAPSMSLAAGEGRAFDQVQNAQAAAPIVRGEFADTAYWTASLATDAAGRAKVTIKLPDNLTTWVMRGVGLTGETKVGEGLNELIVTKPLLIRPVTPRFFVVGDRVELSANISNNTDSPLEAQVALATTGLSVTTPLTLTINVPARGEAVANWQVTAQDLPAASLVFSAVSGRYGDASKPRLASGPEGSLPIYRYSAPENVGTGGQLEAAGSRTEVVALPSNIDTSRGELTVRIDPSLAAGMRDSLEFLEHYTYECTEQTVSRFLPNVLTARALSKLGVPNAELEARLPALVDEGRTRLYNQQHDNGGWGWWYEDVSNPHISAYVVFALLRAKESGFEIKDDVLSRGLDYLSDYLAGTSRIDTAEEANLQAWLLYVLSSGGRSDATREAALYDQREKLSSYGRALLAMNLHISGADVGDGRIKTLLADLNNAAIMSANGAHWEEDNYDRWSMNTDTRSTAIILAALVQLDPASQLNPNVVRWLMVARKDGIWETTQESAWSIIALTDWMVYTGELKADYDYAAWLNDQEQSAGHIAQADVDKPVILNIDVAKLLRDQGNRLTIGRGEGPGRLYYTAYLRAFLPVEEIKALNRGVIVSRRYTLASCLDGPKCPEVTEVKLGDVVRVELSISAPNDLYYLALEDPLPAGAEAIDTGLATTSLLAEGASLVSQPQEDADSMTRWYWGWWHWYSRSELRDEKVVLFADYLAKGSYQYTYTMRATTVGEFHVIPTTASEMYFPDVYGRGDGAIFTVTR